MKQCGIGATLYILRDDKLKLAGFLNAKLKKYQVSWMPCELEALCIGTAIKHFSPYIVQSSQTTEILTDSKPCVQAFDKLQRGDFSASAHVTTFLSMATRYQVHIRHVAGVSNLPSDYTSRHPLTCTNHSCQLCKFIYESTESTVRNLSVKDVIEGAVRMPFTSRVAWYQSQHECPDLRRTHAHLTQGTRPSKKDTNIRDVKRYLKEVTLAGDGLISPEMST